MHGAEDVGVQHGAVVRHHLQEEGARRGAHALCACQHVAPQGAGGARPEGPLGVVGVRGHVVDQGPNVVLAGVALLQE